MMRPSQPWCQLESSPDQVTVRFLPCEGSDWNPGILNSMPLEGRFSGRSVLLEGKAPLWMYAHAALVARRSEAAKIEVYQPQQMQPVQIYPLPTSTVGDPGWLRSRLDPAGGEVIEFQRHPKAGLWSPRTLGSLRRAGASWDSRLITLTGLAPNWLYAAAACLAADLPGRMVTYFSPRDGTGILLNPLSGQEVEMPPSPSLLTDAEKRGRVIGVVGDPNSGKSVFSILLEKGFQFAGIGSLWRLDCDHAAPTPHWYLQMLGQNRTAQAKELRERQKREWTAEAECSLEAQLRHCAASLRWVIADFPGGIHKRQPVERIPAGREVLIGAADYFVILARRDKPESAPGWREALARHDLDSRIIAFVESVDYQSPLDLRVVGENPIRAEVDGLDRGSLADPVLRDKLPPWAALAGKIASRVETLSSP